MNSTNQPVPSSPISNGIKADHDDSDNEENEQSDVEAAENVINAMLYYTKYFLLRMKRQADAAKFVSNSLQKKDFILFCVRRLNTFGKQIAIPRLAEFVKRIRSANYILLFTLILEF
jgi:hypothetical protein